MTVNWERLSGEDVEQFVAALILLRNPRGNRITPSRGDRGVDIIVDTPDGADIYQVKRFTRPLGSTQMRDVSTSWDRFVTTTLTRVRVRSWTLVCPWNPTPERRDWLVNEITATQRDGIEIGWLGLTQLDVMAADHPELEDYYFSGGANRALDLLAQVIGADIPSAISTGSSVLDSVLARQQGQLAVLNQIDPFYRYETEICDGDLDDVANTAPNTNNGATASVFQQISDDRYAVIRVYALCAESAWLRPIRFALNLRAEPDTPQFDALQRFALYGAPFDSVEGTVTESVGPPGIAMPPGEGLFSISSPPAERPSFADIELRLLDSAGAIIRTVDLVSTALTTGLTGTGQRLTATDASQTLHVEILVNVPDLPSELRLALRRAGGRSPLDVMPVAAFAAASSRGTSVEIALRGGAGTSGPMATR